MGVLKRCYPDLDSLNLCAYTGERCQSVILESAIVNQGQWLVKHILFACRTFQAWRNSQHRWSTDLRSLLNHSATASKAAQFITRLLRQWEHISRRTQYVILGEESKVFSVNSVSSNTVLSVAQDPPLG